MRPQTMRAILDAVVRIGKITAAFVTQCIEGAVAKQAAECFLIRPLVAGEKYAEMYVDQGKLFEIVLNVFYEEIK